MKPIAKVVLLVFAAMVSGCGMMEPARVATVPQAPILPASTPASEALAPQKEDSLYLNVISGLVEQQHYGAALAFLDDYALKQKVLAPRYWLLRGDALLGSGQGADAALAYARLQATGLAAEGWNGRGQVAASSRQWKDAEGDFEKAATAQPANAQFLNNLAFARIHLGQTASATFNLRQAHELDPNSVLIRNNLIVALDLSGDAAGAERVLAEIKSPDERRKVGDFARNAVARNGLMEGEKS
jgi:Flp pilus assembly protein TadD